jgi:hypothetical protein
VARFEKYETMFLSEKGRVLSEGLKSASVSHAAKFAKQIGCVTLAETINKREVML